LTILVTGVAGFIGFHTARALLARGEVVTGMDNLNDYYDVSLKRARLRLLEGEPLFRFEKVDVADRHAFAELFTQERPETVVHLAAQAGVRHAITHPHVYVDANLTGFLKVLECCRHNGVQHLVFASSSSVYGANTAMPFSEHQNVDHPVSLYGATKKANELMAHAYAHLYRLPVTGLRFFTVYGPWGRPDMVLFQFYERMLADEPIDVFNHGRHRRDFTYIDDAVEAVVRTLGKPAAPAPAWDSEHPDPASSSAPYRLYNVGNNQPVELLYVISCLERSLGRKAKMNLLPLQPGDVPSTCADIDALAEDIGFQPKTRIEDGIANFVTWYRSYYGHRPHNP
jgi:UDP-glucuronate 4-epimerase